MIELRADVELKDNIVVAMPKITMEGHYTCNVRVEYEWKPPRCSSCKVFRHIHEECTKNTGAGEKKTVKKPSQTFRGVPVGLQMGFKPQKEYRPISKNPNVSSCGNKKKGVEPTIEVSNSNPFDVLNLVDNDVEFGTNRRTTNLVNNGATSSGSSFMNIDNDGEFASNTPSVPTGIVESDSEVEVVFDETANLRISTSGKDGSDKEDHTRRMVKKLKTYNGFEFWNSEFEQLCTALGSGMPKTFSAEFTCTTTYLINRSQSTTVGKRHIWRCARHLGDSKMLRGAKGYRLDRLDDESPKIATSRNVIFNESVMYKGTLKDSNACIDKYVEKLRVEVELQGLIIMRLRKIRYIKVEVEL
nr:hypothetical protein [Tanacetum cinerariifolium]